MDARFAISRQTVKHLKTSSRPVRDRRGLAGFMGGYQVKGDLITVVPQRSRSAEATSPGLATFEGAPFILGESAPDPGLLAGLDGPSQAGFDDLAATAYSLGFFDLAQRGGGVPDSEEQLGVLVQAGTVVAPRHQIAP